MRRSCRKRRAIDDEEKRVCAEKGHIKISRRKTKRAASMSATEMDMKSWTALLHQQADLLRRLETLIEACMEAERRALVLPMVKENDDIPPKRFVLQDKEKLLLEGETATASVDREVVHKSAVQRL